MAQDYKNFVDPKLIEFLEKSNELIIANGKSIDTVLLPAIKKLEDAQSKLGKETKDNDDKRKKLTASEKEAARIAKQLETTEQKLLSLQKGQQDALLKTKTELQKTTAAKKRELTSTNALTGSYIKINAELNKNITRYKGLSEEQRKNSKVGGQLLTTIQRQDKALKKLDTQMGRSQRNVGNYGTAFKSLIGAFGVAGGILGFVSVLKNAGNTIAQFDQAQATTAATLGKTKDEIEELTKASIDFGKTTQFNSVQVSILQNELAKLGFTTDEIKASTGAILDLAEATGAGLGEAAKVVGSTLRGFNLDAAETARVASVLAVATTRSALSFSDYESGLSNVVPVAKAFNFDIEDTIALYGKLRDSGFDASKATTALRNIILNLADSNGKLAKELGGNITNFDEFIPAMVELRESGVDLNTTLQLTDKRSVAAFNTFLNSAESAKVLRDSLIDVNDELADMVETKTDNVIGASKRLGSAWDGLVLKFKGSTGVFATAFDAFATFLNAVTNETVAGAFSGGLKQQEIQQDLAKRLKSATEEQIQFTIKSNRDRLLEEGAHGARVLLMLKERLAELVNARRASEERIREEREKTALIIEPELTEKEIKERERLAKKTVEIEKELQQDLLDIQLKAKQEQIDNDADFVAQADKDIEKEAKEIEKRQQAEDEAAMDRINDEIERLEEFEARKTEILTENEELRKQVRREAGNAVFGIIQSSLDKQLQQEDLTEKEIAKIQRKKSAFAAAQALFNIGLDTFQSVFAIQAQAAILASNPFTAPLAALALAQIPKVITGGAIAGALVLAQQIPAFAGGVTNFGGGVAELAEKGSELVKESSGKVWLAENRGLYNLKQGTSVFPTGSQQTQNALNDKNIVKELKLTRRAIQNQPRQRKESRFDARRAAYWDMYNSRRMN